MYNVYAPFPPCNILCTRPILYTIKKYLFLYALYTIFPVVLILDGKPEIDANGRSYLCSV